MYVTRAPQKNLCENNEHRAPYAPKDFPTRICSRGFHPGNGELAFVLVIAGFVSIAETARTNRETAYKDTRG